MELLIKEIRYILSSKWRFFFFLVLPPLITIYFGLVFQEGIIEHTRTVVVDQDQSSLSRSLLQEFYHNRGFNIVGTVDDAHKAIILVEYESTDIVVAIPSGFSRDIKEGKSPAVLLIANAANMAISSNALKRASEIILTFNAGTEIKTLQGKGFAPSEAENIALPLKFHYRQVGNPSGSFYDFLLWGLMGAVGHFPIMMFSAAALKKKPNWPGPGEVIIKAAAYTILGTLEMLLCILLAVLFFPITFNGSLYALIFLVTVFVLAVVSLGIFLSIIMPNQIMASQGAVVVALPALLLSGHTWPMSGFPGFIRFLGYLEPLTYYADSLRELGLGGKLTLSYWKDMAILGLMIVIYNVLSILICEYRKKVGIWKREALSG